MRILLLTLSLVYFATIAWALEKIPSTVLNENQNAVRAIAEGSPIQAIWVQGKFGEYGDPVHVIRFNRDGDVTSIEGKFIRLGDDLFQFFQQGRHWRVQGKFGDGGGNAFLVNRGEDGRIVSIHGRFYHAGEEFFSFLYNPDGNLQQVIGKFGNMGTDRFELMRDEDGRISEIQGKFLSFGDNRYKLEYYDDTNLVQSVVGHFARWGDDRFTFYYVPWQTSNVSNAYSVDGP